MAILSDNTVLAHPETGVPVVLLKGEEVPDWATDLVGDHLIEGGAAEAQSEDSDALPPTSGKGSGVEAWQKYADDKGVAYAEGASRDEIIAAVEARKAEQ